MPHFRLREDWSTGPVYLHQAGRTVTSYGPDREHAKVFRTHAAAAKVAERLNRIQPFSSYVFHFYVEADEGEGRR